MKYFVMLSNLLKCWSGSQADIICNFIFQNMSKNNPIFLSYNIDGAPFKIGEVVRILNNPNNDECFNNIFSNLYGEIIYFEYTCGCGQCYPDDPMIGVKFINGKVEEFWKEELTLDL